MKRHLTLATFRKVETLHEMMIRATMPRTSAADQTPLLAFAAPTASEVIARRVGSRLVRPVPVLTFKLEEVAHA